MSETSPGGLSCQRARVNLYSRSIRTASTWMASGCASSETAEISPANCPSFGYLRPAIPGIWLAVKSDHIHMPVFSMDNVEIVKIPSRRTQY